ncbi:MAG: bifunctional methylenetetrahydrofolate dehydrogenase/methenyltetrahydrofolate cyclohydrolase [Mycoplasmataceae bacterium]|nr:bifunctional methylenetetrahydrofolate dehydrogenase/methenyltetrahydrofolate cyclohydrolase [Mycoplasmataceae bacterium]
MNKILDGIKLSEELYLELQTRINKAKLKPTLAVIQVGNLSESNLYIEHKKNKAKTMGINFKLISLPKTIQTSVLVKEISKLNNDIKVDGILIQLPLPKQIDLPQIFSIIDPNKDVDGFHPYNRGQLDFSPTETTLVPPTAKGVITLMDKYDISVKGKHVVVLGAGIISGKPIVKLLLNMGATISICTKETLNIKYFIKKADIVISAVGYRDFFHGKDIKKGAVIINIGITKTYNKVYGDPHFDSVLKKASFITPTPGGTGPMTVYHLLENTVICAEKKLKNGTKKHS